MEHVDLSSRDGVAVITLNRPERLNAYTKQMQREIIDAFDIVDGDDSVRAAVVTGAGRAFCAGVDLGSPGGVFDPDDKGRGGPVVLRIHRCRKPVVGAINGAAVGLGGSLLCAMDVRIAAPSARVGFVFVRRGLVPDGVSTWFLPRIVGIDVASEWFFSGRIVEVDELVRVGFVREVVHEGDLVERACAMAREMVESSSSAAIAVTKRLLWRVQHVADPAEAYELEQRASEWLGRQPDAAEGIRAFLDKRAPQFPMSVRADLPPSVLFEE
jgi:enoyl-CoA hydratase/carnithine racemase